MLVLSYACLTLKRLYSDSFDARSFFQLHDLDRYVVSMQSTLYCSDQVVCRDGLWNKEEIEAIYGVHHVYSQKKSKVRHLGTDSTLQFSPLGPG